MKTDCTSTQYTVNEENPGLPSHKTRHGEDISNLHNQTSSPIRLEAKLSHLLLRRLPLALVEFLSGLDREPVLHEVE